MHCSALVCVVLALLLNCPNMDLLKELVSMGEALGYEGDTLRAFVKGMRELQKDKKRKKNVSINLKKRKQNLKIR